MADAGHELLADDAHPALGQLGVEAFGEQLADDDGLEVAFAAYFCQLFGYCEFGVVVHVAVLDAHPVQLVRVRLPTHLKYKYYIHPHSPPPRLTPIPSPHIPLATLHPSTSYRLAVAPSVHIIINKMYGVSE